MGALLADDGAEMLGMDLGDHLPVGGCGEILRQLLLNVVAVVDQFVVLVELHGVHHSDQIFHDFQSPFGRDENLYQNC